MSQNPNQQDKYDWTGDELQAQIIHWSSLADYMEQLARIELEEADLSKRKSHIHKVIADQFKLLTKMYMRLAQRQTD